MKLVLTGIGQLEELSCERPEPSGGRVPLRVLYCAICRTDAKMWQAGHRDLILPRVLGHELVGVDDAGNRYAVWPGQSCGMCSYCRSGRENLCAHMEILGFHADGGFARWVRPPEESLVPLPDGLAPLTACLAEPVGCTLHAIEKLDLQANERVAIYGGGTVGMLAALVCREKGAEPLVIEKSARKIDRARPFLDRSGIECVKETHRSEFAAVLNACPDPIAFGQGISKLARGGRFAFFSGLVKNSQLSTDLVNLLHYKEVAVFGAYGLTRNAMVAALPMLAKNADLVSELIEAVISPTQVAGCMPVVLTGDKFRYVIDFDDRSPPASGLSAGAPAPVTAKKRTSITHMKGDKRMQVLPDALRNLIAGITPPAEGLRPDAQTKIDNKTKPLGALGKLEDLAVQMSVIQNDLNPGLRRKALFVFAGDHGIAEEGVSAFPAEVTGQMVSNFLAGGAAINVICRHHGIEIKVVDMGVNADFDDHPILLQKKVRKGTRNFAVQNAMTADEASQALRNGVAVFQAADRKQAIDIVGLGEMGIANTTSATAIICAVTGVSPFKATGRGTGVDDKGLEHKALVIQKALDFHKPDPTDGFDILQRMGGFEIAGITGAVLAAAAQGTAVVLDGVISTAAGLIAYLINPDIRGYLIAGHRSVEISQTAALEHMRLEPVIDFGMRLGEGTGAAMTIDVVDASCRIMREMASFGEAEVSQQT